MVAGAQSDALLADFQREIQRALDDGTTLADFRKSFDQIVERHGWTYNGTPGWRSRVIYETNLSTAYSAGRYAQMHDPDVLRAFPYWTYRHGDSQRPRPMHLAWNGLTLRADDPFWDSHYRPNGWRCSCSVSPTGEPGLRRMGKDGPDASPPIERVPWRNPHTGAVHMVPKGIDPGFDYNPGQAWQDGGRGIPVKAPALRPLRKDDATDVASPVASAEQMRAFVRHPAGQIVAGELAAEVAKEIGAESPFVQLSAETMAKQQEHHPDLTEADYARLTALLNKPDLVLEEAKGRLRLFLRHGERPLSAAVKTTEDRGENYLLTVHRTRRRSIRTMQRKWRTLQGTVDDLFE